MLREEITHYIEVFYPYNPDRGSQEDFTWCKAIVDRNPLLYIEKYNNVIGFRFFDLENNKRKNNSPIYYYGRYMSEQEIEQVHKVMPFTININKMIYCYCGYWATDLNAGDIPLDEYINLISNNNPNSRSKKLLEKKYTAFK